MVLNFDYGYILMNFNLSFRNQENSGTCNFSRSGSRKDFQKTLQKQIFESDEAEARQNEQVYGFLT